MYFSPADVLLWTRCRRQWVRACLRRRTSPGGEPDRRPALPAEMIGEATLREQARVIAEYTVRTAHAAADLHGASRGETGIPAMVDLAGTVLDPEETERWIAATLAAIRDKREFVHGVLPADGAVVLVDHGIFHEKVEAWEFSLIRPATGIRGVYHTEAALVALAAERNSVALAGIHLRYLRKNARLEDHTPANLQRLYAESNLLKRSRKAMADLAGELAHLSRPETLQGVVDPDYRCKPGCDLCSPREGRGHPRYSVYSLHKGGDVVRRLVEGGITDIRTIPSEFPDLSVKQRIQIQSVVTDQIHVDHEKLKRFLSALKYPLWFLDFEAFAMSLPLYEGIVPYGHTPVIASVHRQATEGSNPEEFLYASRPGRDERKEFFSWISETVGTTGTIVVFSKTFESAMVRQLAERADRTAEGALLEKRMVDLLVPFSEFWIYHPDQWGKVSLKRVLPAFCETAGYEEESVRDGMHANLGLIRLTDRKLTEERVVAESILAGAEAAEGTNTGLERAGTPSAHLPGMDEIAAYCTVDTLAMYHLVRQLTAIMEEGPYQEKSPPI
jgi:hypothetical protein